MEQSPERLPALTAFPGAFYAYCSRAALTWTRAAAITTNHDLAIGGTFEGTVDFGTGEITSPDDDAFIFDFVTD